MQFAYSWKWGALVLLLAAAAGGAVQAQAAPDSAGATPRRWLLKGGLSLTRLSYSRAGTTWQVLLPLALAAERRLSARYSGYFQLQTDLQCANARNRRRRAPAISTAFPSSTLSLGGRCYYGRPALPGTPWASPEFGKYLALEAEATFISAARTARVSSTQPYGSSRAAVAPALYARWGIQNRLRPHVLYDLSAGLGVLAPTRSAADDGLPAHGWDVSTQLSVQLYLAR